MVFIAATNSCICNCCLLQNISTSDGPPLTYQYDSLSRLVPSGAADAGTAGRPFDIIRSCVTLCQHIYAHRTLRNTDHLIGLHEKPTEKSSVSVSVLFGLNRPKPTDVLGKNRKTDRATFHFRFTTLLCRTPASERRTYVSTIFTGTTMTVK